jgi:hypothetical protein
MSLECVLRILNTVLSELTVEMHTKEGFAVSAIGQRD